MRIVPAFFLFICFCSESAIKTLEIIIFFQMFSAAKVVLFSDISKCFCEKVVFIPLTEQDHQKFVSAGYKIVSPEDYILQ